MTREEAIIALESIRRFKEMCGGKDKNGIEALDLALRPVSREQVEQIKGVWIFNDDWWEFRCSKCHKGIGNIEKFKFCPHCGAPMTDEAVDMTLRRWKEAFENA